MKFNRPSPPYLETGRIAGPRKPRKVVVFEFTPRQLKAWIALLCLLSAGSYLLGVFVARMGTDNIAVGAEENQRDETGSASEEEVSLSEEIPDPARMHPPDCRAHEDPISAIALSPDGAFLATTSWDSTIKLWSAISGDKLDECDVEDAIWHALALSPEGRYAACGDAFKMMERFGMSPGINLVHVWDLKEKKRVLELDLVFQAFAFSPAENYLAVLDESDLWIYETRTWQMADIYPVRNDDDAPFIHPALAFSPDGNEATVLDLGRRVTISLTDGARTTVQAENPPPEAEFAAVLPVEPFLTACGGETGSAICRFDPEEVRVKNNATPFPEGPMVFTPDGAHLLTADPEGFINLLSVPDGVPVRRFTRYVEGMVALPKGKHVIAHDENHVFLFAIQGAPMIQYFADESEPEDYQIQDWEEDGEIGRDQNEMTGVFYHRAERCVKKQGCDLFCCLSPKGVQE